MGICFVGKRKLEKFLDQYLEPEIGEKILVRGSDGQCEPVGMHLGLHSLTIGQRASVSGAVRGFRQKFTLEECH
jgi:tRNA U34 2-thiouridine synthase MnmA/TrmU